MDLIAPSFERVTRRSLAVLATILLSTAFAVAIPDESAAMDIRNFGPRGAVAPRMVRPMPGPGMVRMRPSAGMMRVPPGAGMARMHHMQTRPNAAIMMRMHPNAAFVKPQMGARNAIKMTGPTGRVVVNAGAAKAIAATKKAANAPTAMQGRHATKKRVVNNQVASNPVVNNGAAETIARSAAKSPAHGFKKNIDLGLTPPQITPCPDCMAANGAIRRYEDIVSQEEARLRALKDKMATHQRELGTMTDPGMRNAWQKVIDSNARGIAETEELLALIKTVLEERRTQAQEKVAAHHPGAGAPPATNPPTEAPPAVTTPVTEAPPATEIPPTLTSTTRTATTTATATISTTTPTSQPTPNRVGLSNPCPDHVAELTNSNRVFHRLYVMAPDRLAEQISWGLDLKELRGRLEAPSRQANGSTTQRLDFPSPLELKRAIRTLQERAQECEEVTLYFNGHGSGGLTKAKLNSGYDENDFNTQERIARTGEPIPEKLNLGDGYLWDEELGDMLKGFRPNVSITVIMNSCYGGGFAGKNQVEESDLVQLIGLYTACFSLDVPGRTTLSEAVGEAVDQTVDQNGRSTVRDVKGRMAQAGWPLGAPFDNPTDFEVGPIGSAVGMSSGPTK